MISKFKTFIAVAALSGTVGANVHAAELTVKKGDTLWELSKVHNTSVEELQKWNELSTDLIFPGDVLTVAIEKQYTVVQDDTLWDIAKDYQVPVTKIKEWNQLNTDLIHPGLDLVIYDDVHDFSDSLKEKPTSTVAQAKPVNTASEEQKGATTTSTNAIESASKETPSVKETDKEGPTPTASEVTTKEITVKATAYTASCEGCSGTTATGLDLIENPNAKVIAVDPKVIPLGSKVYVEGYGEAIASDTGGAIKGNRIDVFIPTEDKALEWGRKEVKVQILD